MNRWCLVCLGLVGMMASCASEPPPVEQRRAAVTAYCTATVNGVGQVDVETDYLPHVVQCENGGAPLEALKAQAVAARTYLYYKLDTSGSVNDGTSDQVYSCGATPSALHIQAVQETAGQVLTYNGSTICAFFVAGGIPSASSCVWASGDSDPTGTEHYVTYNWNLSGSNIEQTTLGWVSPSNVYNRGCQSQNGAHCLADEGWGYQDILRFYYGMDINIETAVGSCVTTPECTAGDQETQDCELCGVKTRTCDSTGSWGAWSGCEQQGECEPGDEETEACGECGQHSRTCSSACAWGQWGTCESVSTTEPCDTGMPGICGPGQLTCQDAELVCTSVQEPALEQCDDLDNDCNGEVDDGIPPVLGDPPPALAAELSLTEAPDTLVAGTPANVVIRATNVGSQQWAPGDLVLHAVTDGAGGTSPLYVADAWEAGDTVVTLDETIPPGAWADFLFPIQVASGSTEAVHETFWLYTAQNAPVACPAPAVSLDVEADGRVDTGRPDAGPGVDPGEVVRSGCGCQQGPTSGTGLLWLLLVALGWRRRRAR